MLPNERMLLVSIHVHSIDVRDSVHLAIQYQIVLTVQQGCLLQHVHNNSDDVKQDHILVNLPTMMLV